MSRIRPIPTGTVTLLFTDVEGSTRLWEAEPVAMAPALRRHDELLRGPSPSKLGISTGHRSRSACEKDRGRLRRSMGEEDFAAACREGAALTRQQAVDLALGRDVVT